MALEPFGGGERLVAREKPRHPLETASAEA